MAKLWQFSQINPKPAFSEKVQRGDQEKFCKSRPKRSPRLKGAKALWRKWHYSQISIHLNRKDWKRFWRKLRLQIVSERPSYGNFRKLTQNPHFLKKCKGGDQGKFFKNRPRSCFRLEGPTALLHKWHYPLISMHL